MESLKLLANYCSDVMIRYPELRDDVEDFYQLCLDEIEQGGSVSHEIELCMGSIEEAIEDYENI